MPHPRQPGAMSKAEERFGIARFFASLEETKAIPIAQVLEVFGDDAPGIFTDINNYQWAKQVGQFVLAPLNGIALPSSTTPYATELMKAPLPSEIRQDVAGLMMRNVATFDPLEDSIDIDGIIIDLQPRVSRGSKEMKLLAAQALRARRVVVAACATLEIPYGSEGLIAQIQALSPSPTPEG